MSATGGWPYRFGASTQDSGLPTGRFIRWTTLASGDPTATLGAQLPGAAGLDVHGVVHLVGDLPGAAPADARGVRPACAGAVALVEAAAAFAVGANLATDALGRAKVAGAGETIVAQALSPSTGAGSYAWVVFASGR